jgi:hypothetical protein
MTKRWNRLAIGLGLNVALGSGVALAQVQGWSNIPPSSTATMHATNCFSYGDGNIIYSCVFSQEGIYACVINPTPGAVATAGAACANNHVVLISVDINSAPIAIMSTPNP